MPHGSHIYATAADISMDIMCAYTPSKPALPHWKYALCCCSNCPHIDPPDQESDKHYSNASPSIHFHIYYLIARCKVHRRRLLYEKKSCGLCFQYLDTTTPAKLYTRKELVMMETSIADFHTNLYIPEIQTLTNHLPHVHIIGTNHYCNTRREAFKFRIAK